MPVDHFSDIHKVVLMRSTTQDETLDAKFSVEKFFKQHGHNITAWHADNVRYAEKDFKEAVSFVDQTITFCGVGAHQQNGIAESKIKHLTLGGRTMLLHAQRRPEYITTMLWLFALLAAADRMNNLHIDIEGNTPEMKFSKVSGSTTRLGNFHTFGCPVYVLDSRLQDAGGPGPPVEREAGRPQRFELDPVDRREGEAEH